jgi:hypothetical protein
VFIFFGSPTILSLTSFFAFTAILLSEAPSFFMIVFLFNWKINGRADPFPDLAFTVHVNSVNRNPAGR